MKKKKQKTQTGFLKFLSKDKRPVPKTQEGSIPYQHIWENGIMELFPGYFSKSYHIGSVNFLTATDNDQWNIGQAYANFLGSFEKEATIEITLFNRSIDIEKFKASVLLEMQDDNMNLYREEYNNMLLDKMSAGRNNLTTDRILTVSVPAENIKEAIKKFARIDVSVTDEMSRITKTECSVLSAIERLELLNDVYNMDDNTPLYQKRMIDGHMVESFSLKECEAQGRTTQSYIVPGQLSFGQYEKNIGNVIKVGNMLARPYYVSGYPSWLRASTLTDFSTLSGNILISAYFTSESQGGAADMLKRQTRNIRSGIIDRQQKSSTTTDVSIIAPDLSEAKQEADELQESIAQDDNRLFYIDKINAMFERIGIEFCLPAPKVIDTLPCARDCFPDLDSYKLQDIVENIDTENQFRYHNSLEDIKATALVLEQEVKKYQQLLENIYAQPFKRTAHLNWASCNINTRAKSQQRIKLNIDEDLYGNIFWDIPKKRWDCKRDKKSTQLFAEINMTNLEEQVLHRYGHRYSASNMDELGANWLREKKEKEKNKKSA